MYRFRRGMVEFSSSALLLDRRQKREVCEKPPRNFTSRSLRSALSSGFWKNRSAKSFSSAAAAISCLPKWASLVLTYADEIFSAGRELMSAVKQRPGGRALRLNVGMTDALSKFIGFQILKPAFYFSQPVHVVCRQAEIGPLVNQLQAHRLDIVLADEPASSSLKAKTFNHRLGRSGVTFCAVPANCEKAPAQFSQVSASSPGIVAE